MITIESQAQRDALIERCKKYVALHESRGFIGAAEDQCALIHAIALSALKADFDAGLAALDDCLIDCGDSTQGLRLAIRAMGGFAPVPPPLIVGGWISCDDRLPEHEPDKWSEPVVALTDVGSVFIISRMNDYWQRTAAVIMSGATKVTHWIPLPKE